MCRLFSESLSPFSPSISLTPGRYTAGIDFPCGICSVTAAKGQGNFISSNWYCGGVNTVLGADCTNGLYRRTIRKLELSLQTTLFLDCTLQIDLFFSRVDTTFPVGLRKFISSFVLPSGIYRSGTDFPPGVYSLHVINGSGILSYWTEYGDSSCISFCETNVDEFGVSWFHHANITSKLTIEIGSGLELQFLGEAIETGQNKALL